jgi:hypothetical protein
MPMNPRLLRPIASGVHPEAAAWRSAVVANGGSVSASTMKAVSKFCADIDAAGIRDRFYRVNLFAGTGLNACLVPLYRGQSRTGTQFGNSVDQSLGSPSFAGTDYAETGASGGLVGNGTSKYLNTGLKNNDLPQNNAHISVYETVIGSNTFRTAMGARASFNNAHMYISTRNPATVYGFSGTQAGEFIEDTSYQAAHYLGCITGNTASQLYKNGTEVGSSAATTRTPTAVDLFVFGLNTSGTVSLWSSARLGAYSAGLGMTATQATSFYNAMQAFQTALGRNV